MHQYLFSAKYRKQQKLSGRKLSWFLQILDELRKFPLLIDRHRAVDIITVWKQNREGFLNIITNSIKL